MVGGFSESDFLQRKIKDSFEKLQSGDSPRMRISCTERRVLYGHDPDIIAARVVKYTYGVDVNSRFIEDKHPESKKKLINGIEYCTDKFDIHVNRDTLVHCSEETKKFYPQI